MSESPSFFDPTYPVWESYDPKRELLVARVAFVDGPDGVFDYKIPERLAERVVPGVRVLVPLGAKNRSVTAYCLEVKQEEESPQEACEPQPRVKKSAPSKKPAPAAPSLFAELEPIPDADPDASESCAPADSDSSSAPRPKRFRLKEITDAVDAKPLLTSKGIELALWIAKRWLAPIGATLDCVVPAGVRDTIGSRLTTVYVPAPDLDKLLKRVDSEKQRTAYDLLTPKQRYVLDELRKMDEPPTLSELARAAKCSNAPITALKNLGLLRVKRVRRVSGFYTELVEAEKKEAPTKPHVLNEEQQAALDQILESIRQEENPTFLLHGATGSGKTEVYIRAIEEIVSYGKQAIVLVPEISLTPQTVQRFRSRLGSVAVLHSRLTDLERKAEWEKIASGKAQVVVGARSAIFAPVPRLGLIVIDEEHETSFKQDVAPRYHARVVARRRAETENVPLILGSATPSLESWRNVQLKNYRLLTLAHRVRNLPQPPVYVVDMRTRTASGFTTGAICRQLRREIETALEADPTNQIVLLLNRRGYSTHMQCPACGETLKCPDCDVALTHHITQQIAICHYCDYQIPAPKTCPYCGFQGVKYGGFGTQKLEQEFCVSFPNAPILRMDSDTTQAKDAHEKGLSAFRRGEYRVLLGTQMIAKGLDFPNVVLVGIVNADVALHLPDYRAAERTFNLILQASGRAGRGDKEGKVVVQSYYPDHPAIVAAMKGDYIGFANEELKARRTLGYPPFSSAVRFVVRGPVESETAEFARELAAALKESIREVNLAHGFDPSAPENQRRSEPEQSLDAARDASGRNFASLRPPKRPRPPLLARIVGPAPAPFAKLRGNFRYHLQLFGSPGTLLREAAENTLKSKLRPPKDVQWIVDVDPLDSL